MGGLVGRSAGRRIDGALEVDEVIEILPARDAADVGLPVKLAF